MVIGLTGGPGAGKSTAAKIMKENGAIIISGDEAGKEVLNRFPVTLKKIAKVFGNGFLADDGSLDRQAMGRLVFSDAAAMEKLNSIIHPFLLRILKERIRDNSRKFPRRLIVVDAALIFEWGIEKWFDKILVIKAKRETRIARMRRSGISRAEAVNRIGSQIPQKEKASRADYVIANDSTKARLRKSVGEFIKWLK